MRQAVEIELTNEERATLESWSKGQRVEVRQALRAQIVLLSAEGMQTKDIAAKLNITRQKAARWRNRFAQDRLEGIRKDAPRGGRSPKLMNEKAAMILNATTNQKPANATHWTVRTLAKHLGVSRYLVHTVWKNNNIKPHLTKTFKVSNDPRFVEKLVDVVGLYLNPPEHAIVLSVDEKTQIQALDRTQMGLPLTPGRCGTMTHDYKRNGTTSLFAAINVADGKVHARCEQKHTHKEWLRFLKQLDRETDKTLDLHIILDNYATHKEPTVMAWIEKHPRIHLHFIPTSSSWLNVIERWFRDITDKQIRRGSFRNVKELEAKIWDYINEHNADPKGFKWTAKADQILRKVERANQTLKSYKQDQTLH